MGVFSALTLDFLGSGSWGLSSSPSFLPYAWEMDPTASPAGSPTASPAVCLGSTWAHWAPTGCSPALTEQLGRGGGSLRGELALVARVSLWTRSCGLPTPPGPPTLSLPIGLSACLSVGQVAQPCQLTDTHFPSPWALRPGKPPHSRVPGRTHGSTSVFVFFLRPHTRTHTRTRCICSNQWFISFDLTALLYCFHFTKEENHDLLYMHFSQCFCFFWLSICVSYIY